MKHIRILALILCACFVPMAWAQQPASMNSNNWSEFHRTNMMRGNPWEKVLNVKNVRNLNLKWSYTTGSHVVSSPAVANGVVYIGSEDHNVYAQQRQHRRQAVELQRWQLHGFLARRGKWDSLCRLE